MAKKYSIGLDFGTEEARGILLDMQGNLIAAAEHSYRHGVMTHELPDGTPLEDGFALQHPRDYIDAMDEIIPALVKSGVSPNDIIGIGVDFTQCTMMPVTADGTPLCFLDEFKGNPYAYVKLWKHHGAQPQAEKLTDIARSRKEAFLNYCGGTIYAESMFPKILETYERAPEVYRAAAEFLELADWTTFYLTGSKTRSRSIAGCAALWHHERGYPGSEYFYGADRGFANVVKEKLTEDLAGVGSPVGYVSGRIAERWGIPEGIPVAAGLGDCQAAFVGAGLVEEGTLLTVMGTSSCDMLVSREEHAVPGLYGVSYDSMLPGMFGYEAGQATMGDLYGWFVKTSVPHSYYAAAQSEGLTIFDYFNKLAQDYEPGQTGLLALDWWNGNRSVLLDASLGGMILGLRLNTKPEEIYRALTEALSFGKRRIVEQFESHGIPVKKIYATGGVAVKNPFLMQMFADVIGLPIYISSADNGSCVGSAVYGAAAASPTVSGYGSITQAARGMGGGSIKTYVPNPKYKDIYDSLYREYKTLYQYFGQDNLVMKRLKKLSVPEQEGRK